MRWLFPVLLFILSPICIFSQDYNYSHYDSRDGLGSATVYCIAQDKNGFLWFGTETGVSRFDGTHFKTFTKEDGLPDNDITQLFADSKGRVWMSPFRQSVCYYYKGKIRNIDNDPLLKKLRIHNNVVHFSEDNAGNILIQEVTRLHLIQPDGRVLTFLTNGTRPWSYITTIGTRKEGGFWVMQDGEVYILRNNRFLLWEKVSQPYDHLHFNYGCVKYETLMWRKEMDKVQVWSFERNKTWQFSTPPGGYVNSVILDQRYGAFCTLSGAVVFDLNTGNVQRHLSGITISNMLKDSEGNLWFSTMGKGIYRLNSSVVLNVDIAERTGDFYRGGSERKSKEFMMAANVYDLIRKYSKENGKWTGHFTWSNTLPIYNIMTLPDGNIAIGSAFFILGLSQCACRETTCWFLLIKRW
jgi:ligand-binding sensor domain-containing protein